MHQPPGIAAVVGTEDHRVVPYGPARVLVVHVHRGEQRPGRHLRLLPACAVVVGNQDVATLARHHDARAGHGRVQQQGRGRQRRLHRRFGVPRGLGGQTNEQGRQPRRQPPKGLGRESPMPGRPVRLIQYADSSHWSFPLPVPCRNSGGRDVPTTSFPRKRVCQNSIRERQRPPKSSFPRKRESRWGGGGRGKRRCSAPPPPLDSRFRGNDGLAVRAPKLAFDTACFAGMTMRASAPFRSQV